jgi:hypothetical protein
MATRVLPGFLIFTRSTDASGRVVRRPLAPAPLRRFATWLSMLADVFREARALQRRAQARWPHLEE